MNKYLGFLLTGLAVISLVDSAIACQNQDSHEQKELSFMESVQRDLKHIKPYYIGGYAIMHIMESVEAVLLSPKNSKLIIAGMPYKKYPFLRRDLMIANTRLLYSHVLVAPLVVSGTVVCNLYKKLCSDIQ